MRRITQQLLTQIRDLIKRADQAGSDEDKWLNVAIDYDNIFGTKIALKQIKVLVGKLKDVLYMVTAFTKVFFDPCTGQLKGVNA